MQPVVSPGNALVTTLPLECANLVFCCLNADDVERLLEACPPLATVMRQLELQRNPNSQAPAASDYWTQHRIATKSTTPLPRIMRLLRPDPTEGANPVWRVARQRLFSRDGIDAAISKQGEWACEDEVMVRAYDPFSKEGSDFQEHFGMLAIAILILKGDIGTVRGALATQASFRSEALKTACLYTYLYNQPHMTAQLTSQDPAYALMAYAREGQRGNIRALLQQCDSGETPLTSEDLQRGFACAALNGDTELMEQLWNRFKSADDLKLALLGATVANNPTWVQRCLSLPLQLSDRSRKETQLIAALLGLSTLIEQCGWDDPELYQTAFIVVIMTRDVQRLRQLVDQPTLISECWHVAFCLAVEIGYLEGLAVLIEKRPSTSAAVDINLWSTALLAAGSMNHIEMMEQIVAAWPQEYTRTSLDAAYAQALVGAAKYGQEEAVQHLLKKERHNNQDLALALRAAAQGNHRDILQLLRTHLPADEKKGALLAVLCGAIEGEQLDLLTQVLRYNSLKAEDWAILLETAVDAGKERILAFLLEYPEGLLVCQEKQSVLLGKTAQPKIIVPLLRVKEASQEDWDRILVQQPEILDLVQPAYGHVDSKTVQTLYRERGSCPHPLLERCSHAALYPLLVRRGPHQGPVALTLLDRTVKAFLGNTLDFSALTEVNL